MDAYGVDRPEVSRIEACINIALHVDLEVQPDSLKDHRRWNPGMHGLSRYVVFRVGILRTAVENESLLRSVVVRKGHFYMKLLLV